MISLAILYNKTWVKCIEFEGESYPSLDEAVRVYINQLPNSLTNSTDIHFGSLDVGSRYSIIVQKYHTDKYASAILFGYALSKPKYYRKSNGNWADTVDL